MEIFFYGRSHPGWEESRGGHLKTKVVHLITLLELGGAQGNTIYTVQNLDPEGFETHLWCGKGAYWDQDVNNKWPGSNRLKFFPSLVRSINPIKDLWALLQIQKELKKLKPTILHTHSSKAGILGRLAGKWAGIPIIIHTYHGFGFHPHQNKLTQKLFHALERWCASFCQKLIFVSKSNMETARHLRIGRPDQYQLIRSGIPLKNLNAMSFKSNAKQIRSEMGIPDASKIVVTVGAFKPQKNLTDFIYVAHQVLQSKEDVHFLIIGDGKLRGHLEQLIMDLNLVGKVHLPGWRKDVHEILSISDVFVLTSLWEGLPRALVEAMALGIPPVCYNTDGIKDLLAPTQKGGIVVPQKNRAAMVEGIQKLLKDSPFWADTSKMAKSLISTEFDIDHMVTQQEILYTSLIQKSDKNHSFTDVSAHS